MKTNCWEFKKCERGPGGMLSRENGVCPAARDIRLHGVHGGKFGGRVCWIVNGTMCNGVVHGSFNEKYRECMKCDFYEFVKDDERDDFVPTILLLRIVEPFES